MPFPSTGGQTIVATMGMNTQGVTESLNRLPQDVKKALNQATQHTTSFSESFGKLFARGDVGERRFHGLISSVIRDLSSARGGAEGLAGAITTVFERMKLGGIAGGAAMVAVGVGFERLVAGGEQLRKTNSELEKSSQQMQHALKLSTAADGYSALAGKAREFHKEERKAHDEAAKDQEHWIRLIERRAEYLIKHPLAGREEVEKHVSKETSKSRELEAKAAAAVRKEDELAVVALERGAQLAQVRLSGSEQEAEMVKLATEYEQRRAEIEVMSKRGGRGDEAMAALNTEFALRQRMIQSQAQAAEREFQASMKQGQLTRQMASDQDRIANIQISSLTAEEKALEIARARGDLAVDRIESAKAEVQAAEDELDAAKNLTTEEQRRAQLRLQNAQNAEQEARTAAKGAAAGVADERAKAIQKGAAERRMSPEEQRKQYWDRQKEYESTVQEMAHRGIKGDLAEPPKMGEADYDPLRKFKAAAAQEELARQKQVEQQKATPEGQKQLREQQEKQNPLVAGIGKDVAAILGVLQGKGGDKGQPDKAPTPAGPQPAPGGTQGQPSPVGPNDGLPKGWKQEHVSGEAMFDPKTGQFVQPPPPPAGPTGVKGARGEDISAETLQAQGIDPTQSMANVDKGKLSEIQANKQAFDKYWKDRQASGADKPTPAAGEVRTQKGGEWQPAGQYGPQAESQEQQPAQPFIGPGMQPIATPEMQQQPPPAQPPAKPEPPPAPSGEQGGGHGMVQAIKEAISQVMDKYWR